MTREEPTNPAEGRAGWSPETPVAVLRGVGPVRAGRLAQAGVATLGDLLRHLPARYEDRRDVISVSAVRSPGVVTLEGRLIGVRRTPTRRRGLALVRGTVEDGSGRLPAIWFNRPFLAGAVDPSVVYRLHGAVRPGRSGEMQLVNASLEPAGDLGRRVVPIYRPLAEIGPTVVGRLVAQAVDGVAAAGGLADPLPEEVLDRRCLPSLGEALRRLHRPSSLDDVEALNLQTSAPHLRLAYGDLLDLQLRLAERRRAWRGRARGHRYRIPSPPEALGAAWLPFSLTGAQIRAFREIAGDLASPRPMARLVQGDVGCGKTAVAALALAAAATSGLQAAMMAPTELLAEQHHESLSRLLAGHHEVGCLTATSDGRERLLERLAAGDLRLVVGTHALLGEAVRFRHLALVVVDEQHRFGVEQRRVLLEKGKSPDLLVMTATPIPRSLALAVYGDLDLTVIDELPPGRAEVRTRTVGSARRGEVLEWLRGRVEAGEKAYVVFPRIDGEEAGAAASIAAAEEAYRAALPEGSVAVLHGRTERVRRREILDAFARGEVTVLLATTLIEVGIDVADATLMIIEGAERFGLAQLHQLRGRIGRGGRPSVCIAVHGEIGDEAERRVRLFAETRDGFRLAEADLLMRGPGELLGARQAGTHDLALLRLAVEPKWLEAARQDARRLLRRAGGAGRASGPEGAGVGERVGS